MKHIAAKAVATILLSTLAVMSIATNAQAQPSCSNATLNGSFGFTNTGTVITPPLGLFAGVGRQTFDGKGNTEATATVSVNGEIYQAGITGTYRVNPDCTGSMTLSISAGDQHLINQVDFVIVSGGKEFRAINKDPGSVITTVGNKQFLVE
jgi:hypothetical protein